MLQIEPLDAAISRLDLALQRADGRRHDPVAVHEVAYCLTGLQALERRPDLDPELSPARLSSWRRSARRCRPNP